MAIFRFLKMAAAAILDFQKLKIFNGRAAQEGRNASLPNLVEIGQTTAEIWRFFDFFQDGGRRHLGFLIFRPHHSITYVDAACCYRPRSVVCLSIGLSVCVCVTVVSPAKMAALIEMSFRLRTLVGPKNSVLDGGPDPPWEGAIFRGEGRPVVKYRTLPIFGWAAIKLGISPHSCYGRPME